MGTFSLQISLLLLTRRHFVSLVTMRRGHMVHMRSLVWTLRSFHLGIWMSLLFASWHLAFKSGLQLRKLLELLCVEHFFEKLHVFDTLIQAFFVQLKELLADRLERGFVDLFFAKKLMQCRFRFFDLAVNGAVDGVSLVAIFVKDLDLIFRKPQGAVHHMGQISTLWVVHVKILRLLRTVLELFLCGRGCWRQGLFIAEDDGTCKEADSGGKNESADPKYCIAFLHHSYSPVV